MKRSLRQLLPGGRFNVSPDRSRAMAAVRGKRNRTTEIRLRAALISRGIRGWTMQADFLPGRPDFLFRRERVAIFVDGCFWHGCPKCGHVPRSNRRFWRAKIEGNRSRDRRVSQTLRRRGFSVIRLWEHAILTDLPRSLDRIERTVEERVERD